jgi:hypothetical protein
MSDWPPRSLAKAIRVAGLGPSHVVVCGTGHALDRLAQAVMQPLGAGHIDGPKASYCVVSTTSWLLAAITFVAVAGGWLVAMSRHRPAS